MLERLRIWRKSEECNWCLRGWKQYLKLALTLKLAATPKTERYWMIIVRFKRTNATPLYTLPWYNSPCLVWDLGWKLNYSFHRSKSYNKKVSLSSFPAERQVCLSVTVTSTVLIASTCSADALDSEQPRKKTATAGCVKKCRAQNLSSCQNCCFLYWQPQRSQYDNLPSSLWFSKMTFILPWKRIYWELKLI